ncbi:hypothetical protein L6452_11479 [Arctium lappa]|uniref:Uncharacterized protein n=1 Tax=Arctium lappa TaxID=4217 RepID=A0ACB9DPD6_ARCLA|nr:hypothetical protein L6452_11479 [Arctium lappa]
MLIWTCVDDPFVICCAFKLGSDENYLCTYVNINIIVARSSSANETLIHKPIGPERNRVIYILIVVIRVFGPVGIKNDSRTLLNRGLTFWVGIWFGSVRTPPSSVSFSLLLQLYTN